MNLGQFRTQVDTAWDIIRKLELGEDRVYRPVYPANPAPLFRHLTYVEIWKLCFREQYYNFQLKDDSLIQFRVESFNPLCMSYVYYECPYTPVMSFDEFLRDYLEVDDWEDQRYLKRDFEDYYNLSNNKEVITPIRYDYSPQLYNEGLHPASHFHFGHKSSIRVGTKKVLLPVSFICFVLRQAYPEEWQHFVQIEDANIWVRNVRDGLEDVNTEYWNTLDYWEMTLL
jgi:hypothetical protein